MLEKPKIFTKPSVETLSPQQLLDKIKGGKEFKVPEVPEEIVQKKLQEVLKQEEEVKALALAELRKKMDKGEPFKLETLPDNLPEAEVDKFDEIINREAK